MSDLLTLETLSKRLGGIPISTLKHRIQQLGIPAAARGSRNKLLFDERAVALLEASDQLMKEGHGINTTRRMLKLDVPAEEPPIADEQSAQDGEVAAAPQPRSERKSPRASEGLEHSLQQLAEALSSAMEQLDAKDRLITQLQEELRRTAEASATFQQKTFYLQSELQRLQGELKESRRPQSKEQAPWHRLWKREPN